MESSGEMGVGREGVGGRCGRREERGLSERMLVDQLKKSVADW